MRIRKNASKILGSASTLLFPHYSPSPPPPQKISSSDVNVANSCSLSSSEVSICELNCSPWDLFDSSNNNDDDLDLDFDFNFNFNSHDDPKEEKEPIIIPAATDNTIEVNKKLEKKVRYCNKRGKGWDCKKPARFPHSFCDYHLAKLRSSKICKPNKIVKNGVVRNKPNKLEAASDSSSYYYYSGFGPWRGKRRVRADVEEEEEEEEELEEGGGEEEEEEEEDKQEEEEVVVVVSGSNKGDDNDEDDAAIAEKRVEVGITYCKKTDGKKWHCKRPAQLPHSALCSHHLAQCRSYNYSYSTSGPRRKIKHSTKKFASENKMKADGLEEADVVGNAGVAGDDEYDDFDCDGEDTDNDGRRSVHHNAGEIKKRRKPMKARSLKSLL